MKMKYKKQYKKQAAFLLVGILFFLTGCGAGENALVKGYHVTAPASVTEKSPDTYAASYLSEDICVIPKDGQTEPTDAVMTAKASMLINDTEKKMLYSHNIYKI